MRSNDNSEQDYNKLSRIITHGDAEDRLEAVNSVCGSIEEIKNETCNLIKLLHDDDLDVRVRSAWALGRLGKDASVAEDALINSLTSGDSVLVETALESLRNIGVANKYNLSYIYKMLKHPSPKNQIEAATIIWEATKDNGIISMNIIRFALLSDNASAILQALRLMCSIGRSIEFEKNNVIELLEHDDMLVRAEAIRCLWHIGVDAVEAIPLLRKKLLDDESIVTAFASLMLKKYESLNLPSGVE